MAGISISGCGGDYHPAYVTYYVWLDGSNDSYCNGTAEIIVPMPLKDGKPLFSGKDFHFLTQGTGQEDKSPQWSISAVTTEYGSMLSFKTKNRTLKTVGAHASKTLSEWYLTDDNQKIAVVNSIMNDPYSPAFNKTTYDYVNTTNLHTFAEGFVYPPNFTSCIIVSDGIKPVYGKNGTIKISLYLSVNDGTFGSIGTFYMLDTVVYVTPDKRGMIPINVSYER